MEKNYPIKIVQGNYFAIAQPLSKIVWSNGSKVEQPLVPNKGDQITVNLVSSSRRYDMRKIYVEDNIVHYECNEYLELGTYSIELRLIQVDGKKYRSYQRNKIQIVATNEEADIKDGNEFDVDTYEISSAVILYAKGDKGDQGDRGPIGPRGPVGPAGPRGFRGEDGQDGLSAYEIAVEQGFVGTEEEWLLSLKGEKGEDGTTDYNELENTPTFKTINGETITGEGDIIIEGGSSSGEDGEGIANISATDYSGSGVPNVVTVTTTKGNTYSFNVYNGAQGAPGRDGNDGQPGANGATPEIRNGYWYINNAPTNVKAEGQDGNDGTTPVISATASVQNTTGTPSVSITKTGSVAEPVFAFEFSGIKGEQGLPGADGHDGTSPTLNYDNVPTNNSSNLLTSGTVFTALQSKEDKFAIITPTLDNNNAFNASVGNYYKVTGNANAIGITLVTPSDVTKLSSCVFLIDNSNGVGVNFSTQNDLPLYQSANFNIDQGKIYEVNALYNGSAWYLTLVEMEVII